MKQESPGSCDADGQRCTCAVCPLLCDDIQLSPVDAQRACQNGQTALLGAQAAEASSHPEAWENRQPISRALALDSAAATLLAARRVLVTGLADATLEAITIACDLAETLNAAIDAGLPDSARPSGPTIARVGEVTAAWEELRDRADLVVFWHCNPTASHPRFIERFVEPTLTSGLPRRTIAVGDGSVMPSGPMHGHLPLGRHLAVEAARCLQMRIAGRDMPANLAEPLAILCDQLYDAIHAATCVAIITDDAPDPVGLEAWSVVHLVRTTAHERPAFHIPLGAGMAGSGADIAGAAAVCTWRYGAAGGIGRADRSGSRFLPAESTAHRLIERGEVDAVLVVGRLSPSLEAAIAARAAHISVVRVCDAADACPPAAGRSIQFRTASTSLATTGTMLREDGRRIVLTPCRPATAPQMRDLLGDLVGVVQRAIVRPSAGGRP